MRCSNCSFALNEAANFCSNCGAPIDGNALPAANESQNWLNTAPPPADLSELSEPPIETPEVEQDDSLAAAEEPAQTVSLQKTKAVHTSIDDGSADWETPKPREKKLRWPAPAIAIGVLVGVVFGLYQQGVLANLPFFRPAAGPLPAYARAFTQNEIQQATASICPDLQDAVYAGASSETLVQRTAQATDHAATAVSAQTFISGNAWVKSPSVSQTWINGVDTQVSKVLVNLQATTINKDIEYSSLDQLKTAYLVSLRTDWLKVCNLTVNYQTRGQQLTDYDTARTKLLALAVSKPQPSNSSNSAAGKPSVSATAAPKPSASSSPKPSSPSPSVSATAPAAAKWWPGGYNPIDKAQNFAFKPVTNFCSSGSVCAKFNLIAKVGCSAQVTIQVQFSNAKGEVVETTYLRGSVPAKTPTLFESAPQAQTVTDWNITSISCS